MKHYLIRLRYDGTNYAGYQRQANADTVGEEVFKALTRIFGTVDELHGCSRTDSGVHANEYCVSFTSDKIKPTDDVVRALNGVLPLDIAVFDCEYVQENFHARYSVEGKEYIYKILNSQIRNPFTEGYCLRVSFSLDTDMLNEECRAFIGTHDFSAFCASGSDVENKVRTIQWAYFERAGDYVTFHIKGDGFLYNMVRIIVGTCIDIAGGKIKKGEIENIILSKDRKNAGHTAPAFGLYLNKVFY